MIILSLCFYFVQPVVSSRVIYIPAGSNPKIIAYLHRSGIDVNRMDSIFLKFFGYPQHGWIDIGTTRLAKADFLYKITHAKAALTQITLIPGETTDIFFEQLAQKLGLDKTALFEAYKETAPYPDGVIWPDTYSIPIGITEIHLVQYLVSTSLARHEALAKKFFGLYNQKKWFRYVTIASIIQKEAADEKEMPIIAAVIYNRLKRHMPLQMDGALNYGKYSHVKVTRRRILEDSTPFNTYKYRGLPPYPVGSVSIEALKASINPAHVSYLYFVKGKDGRHIFSNRYKTHIKNIRGNHKSVNK